MIRIITEVIQRISLFSGLFYFFVVVALLGVGREYKVLLYGQKWRTKKFPLPHQHRVCIAGLVMYLICTDPKSMVNNEEKQVLRKIINFRSCTDKTSSKTHQLCVC